MIDQAYVLDASALLAMLGRETGGDVVATIVATALVSAVNWSEVVQKARSHGVETTGLREDLESLGLAIVPFGAQEAEAAAELWHRGARQLAMADRACLATAMVHGCIPVTADRAWAGAPLDVEIRFIR